MEFQSPERNTQVEEYRVQLSGVTILELVVVPDISRGSARASLNSLRLSDFKNELGLHSRMPI
jgi:hypothetical protein